MKKVLKADAASMEELLSSTGYKLRGFRRGEMVTGKVVEVTSKTVLVDIGGKADAVVSEQEYALSKDYFRSLKPGDEVTGLVLVSENDSGQVVLSLRRAVIDQKWKQLEKAMGEDATVKVKVREQTKGGVLVDFEGMTGFIPSSQFGKELEFGCNACVGKVIEVKVVEVDRGLNRLVMSERAVTDFEEVEKRRKALSAVKIGGEYEGAVVGMVPFGVFVSVKVGEAGKEDGVEGLVHISEISWEKVEDVSKVLKPGEVVKVKVIGVDEETGKLALSMKRLFSDPWQAAAAKYPVDSKHVGTVVKLVPYGVLVRLEKGIEGLIHASKMPAGRQFIEGEQLEVFVESLDLERRRLSLGVVLVEKPVDYK